MSSTLTQSTKKQCPGGQIGKVTSLKRKSSASSTLARGTKIYAKIAQLVEHLFEAQGVGGSIPSLGTMYVGVSPSGLRQRSLKS